MENKEVTRDLRLSLGEDSSRRVLSCDAM